MCLDPLSAMETTNMYWKAAVAILIVFALRWLARRFRDPDIFWD
jgi:hypothetical protein